MPPPDSAARWYEDKVRTYGFDHRGLGFRTRTSQIKRFEALAAVGDLDGQRVLDVGCGFGDFLSYLHERGIRPAYTGIDVCEPMVRRCVERFGGDASFHVADVFEHETKVAMALRPCFVTARKWWACAAACTASTAIFTFPSVPFLNPTGHDSPEASSR